MKFLVANDDGIQSPGLSQLVVSLAKLGQVYVVAPASEQSATGQAITMRQPLQYKPVDLAGAVQAYAVNGTPADCIKLGLEVILDDQPDMVVTGMNLGDNLGQYNYYSGTVGAAIEGVLHGLPAIATSAQRQADGTIDWANIGTQLDQVLPKLVQAPWQPGLLLNLNLVHQVDPDTAQVQVCPLNRQTLRFKYHEYTNPKGAQVYWLGRHDQEVQDETDLDLALKGITTVTPIQIAQTDHAWIAILEDHLARH